MKYPRLLDETTLRISRVAKLSLDTPYVENLTVSQALKGGRLNTSRGTMTVEATVVDGPHAGASVLQQGGVVFARYDPAEQHPDGRYLWDD